jgi:transcription antitermination protein NusB
MTRDSKSGVKAGGSKTGATRTRTSEPRSTNKTPATKKRAAKAPAAMTDSPETDSRQTASAKTDAALNRGGKGGGAKNGHAKGQHSGAAGGALRKANKRGAARLAAVQALYQMDMTGVGLNEILAQFESHWLGREVEGEQYLPAEAAFFRDIVSGVVDVQRDLDPRIDAALEATWPLKRIEAILRSVLRAGAYELEKRTDIPARVVVSEYVDVAHAFVDKTETGMVNAVLDRLARNARAEEFG